MTERKHTELPWVMEVVKDDGTYKYVPSENGGHYKYFPSENGDHTQGDGDYYKVEGDGLIIIENALYYPTPPSLEDAEFITRAANSHYDLIEALEELTDLMQGFIGCDFEPDSFTLQVAKKALAKARGEAE